MFDEQLTITVRSGLPAQFVVLFESQFGGLKDWSEGVAHITRIPCIIGMATFLFLDLQGQNCGGNLTMVCMVSGEAL